MREVDNSGPSHCGLVSAAVNGIAPKLAALVVMENLINNDER
jgi:hypothetical protein